MVQNDIVLLRNRLGGLLKYLLSKMEAPITIPTIAIKLSGLKNEVYKDGDVLYIVMAHGHVFIADDTPIIREVLFKRRFYMMATGYAAFHENYTTKLAHSFVMGYLPTRVDGKKMEIDHINHIKLDNRLINLRWVPNGVNNANRGRLSKANKTGVNGVLWNEEHKRYGASWYENGRHKCKMFSVCKYKTKESALKAAVDFRNQAIKTLKNYKEGLQL